MPKWFTPVAIVCALLFAASPIVVATSPDEADLGMVFKIFYYHMPSAWMFLLSAIICGIASVRFLFGGGARHDRTAVSAAELTVLFGAITLVTGPLWARVAWGAWWVWEPRLTLTLLLWFMGVAYFMLRGAAEDPEKGRRFAAILGIVAACDIPIIHLSVQWWRSQHPKPVVMRPEGAQADPAILKTLFVCLFAFTFLFLSLLLLRYGLERLQRRVQALRAAPR